MIITYYGKQFVKISQGELTLAFNPVSKDSKTGINSRFGADIAFISVNHADYNGKEQLVYGDRTPFVVAGPGDYEVRDIFIKGILSGAVLGGKNYINTIYVFELEGIKVVFMGPLALGDLSKDMREAIGEPDIVFMPAGAKDALSVKDAAKLASALEAKLVIPVDYDEASLKMFLKEFGAGDVEAVDKLTLKKKDLEGYDGEVVVLKKS